MGAHAAANATDRRTAILGLLRDLRALEQLLAERRFEQGVTRVGAEQEMFLVDAACRPAPIAEAVLATLDERRATTEIGTFNLEVNLDPHHLGGACFSAIRAELDELLGAVGRAAAPLGGRVLITGILPTIVKRDLSVANMVRSPRYVALNEALAALRGEAWELHIKGTDEIRVRQSSVMAEASNASFQVHLQVDQDDFVNLYNVAQAVTGPTLASATNSPVLFGKRLWSETRIALFEQSVDTRRPGFQLRDAAGRVTFGTGWVRESIVELYREDVTRFRPILVPTVDVDPFAELAAGQLPTLEALRMHTSTVWRWNRGCVGVTDGVAHLRIENRVLPAGPTVVDEIANMALWVGVVRAVGRRYPDLAGSLPFDVARANFVAAARLGLAAHLVWLDGREHPAARLTTDVLVPWAAEGLADAGVDADEIERYLGVIEQRAKAGRTGSSWQIGSLAAMPDAAGDGRRLTAMTAALARHQSNGEPVATWSLASLADAAPWRDHVAAIEQLMSTDLVCVRTDDPLALAADLMAWHGLHQVLVEDDAQCLVGLLAASAIRCADELDLAATTVAALMTADLVTAPPDLSPAEAQALMRAAGVHTLPVVVDGQLVGIVTDHDFARLDPDTNADRGGDER